MSRRQHPSHSPVNEVELRLNCRGCRHFFVTYEPRNPWGCRQFGFKGKNLPAQIVYQSTGMQCAYFSRNSSTKNTAARRRKKKSGILDIDG
jgi:hypothetical protein